MGAEGISAVLRAIYCIALANSAARSGAIRIDFAIRLEMANAARERWFTEGFDPPISRTPRPCSRSRETKHALREMRK